MASKKPKYIVESKSDGKHYFKTKKEICEAYGIGLDVVNHALIGFPLCLDGETTTWICYFTCKDCEDYMIESKNCKKCNKCN